MKNQIQLRSLQLNDKDFFFYLYTHPEVIRYVSSQKTEQEILIAFESRLSDWTETSTHWLCLVIEEEVKPHRPLGLIGFCLSIGDDGQKSAEIGYMIDPSQAGKGIATKALGLLLSQERFKKIHKFSATVTQGNHASEKVLMNNGFYYHETIEKNYKIDGVFYDDVIYLLNR